MDDTTWHDRFVRFLHMWMNNQKMDFHPFFPEKYLSERMHLWETEICLANSEAILEWLLLLAHEFGQPPGLKPSGFNPQTSTPRAHHSIVSRKLDIIGKYMRQLFHTTHWPQRWDSCETLLDYVIMGTDLDLPDPPPQTGSHVPTWPTAPSSSWSLKSSMSSSMSSLWSDSSSISAEGSSKGSTTRFFLGAAMTDLEMVKNTASVSTRREVCGSTNFGIFYEYNKAKLEGVT